MYCGAKNLMQALSKLGAYDFPRFINNAAMGANNLPTSIILGSLVNEN